MKINKEKSDKSRAKILSRLKSACNEYSGSAPEGSWSAAVFPQTDNLLSTFIDEFTKVNGEVVLCDSIDDLSHLMFKVFEDRNWKNITCRDSELLPLLSNKKHGINNCSFEETEVGITQCEYLVARSGSIMVSSGHESGRLMNVFPPIHVVIAKEEQLVPFIDDAISGFKKRYNNQLPSQATFITGPSRTADIEKTLVMGAHGPKELMVFLLKK